MTYAWNITASEKKWRATSPTSHFFYVQRTYYHQNENAAHTSLVVLTDLFSDLLQVLHLCNNESETNCRLKWQSTPHDNFRIKYQAITNIYIISTVLVSNRLYYTPVCPPLHLVSIKSSFLNWMEFLFHCIDCSFISLFLCSSISTPLFLRRAQIAKNKPNGTSQTCRVLPIGNKTTVLPPICYPFTSVPASSVLQIQETLPSLAQTLIKFPKQCFSIAFSSFAFVLNILRVPLSIFKKT